MFRITQHQEPSQISSTRRRKRKYKKGGRVVDDGSGHAVGLLCNDTEETDSDDSVDDDLGGNSEEDTDHIDVIEGMGNGDNDEDTGDGDNAEDMGDNVEGRSGENVANTDDGDNVEHISEITDVENEDESEVGIGEIKTENNLINNNLNGSGQLDVSQGKILYLLVFLRDIKYI